MKQKKEKKDSPKRTILLSAHHLDLILNLLLPFTGLKGWAFGTGGRVCLMRSTAVDK
jgi:hypothetical protein